MDDRKLRHREHDDRVERVADDGEPALVRPRVAGIALLFIEAHVVACGPGLALDRAGSPTHGRHAAGTGQVELVRLRDGLRPDLHAGRAG